MTAQITELLTNYGPIAAIWLDGIAVPLSGDRTKFAAGTLRPRSPLAAAGPRVLQTGSARTEDFFAPEHKAINNPSGNHGNLLDPPGQELGLHATNRNLTTEEAWAKLVAARQGNANLLLNTGPMPDGSIAPATPGCSARWATASAATVPRVAAAERCRCS